MHMRASPPEWYLAPQWTNGDRRAMTFVSCASCGHLFIAPPKLFSHELSRSRHFRPHPKESRLSQDFVAGEIDPCPFCQHQLSECRASTAEEIIAAGFSREDYE
jgi:hypothetical protein